MGIGTVGDVEGTYWEHARTVELDGRCPRNEQDTENDNDGNDEYDEEDHEKADGHADANVLGGHVEHALSRVVVIFGEHDDDDELRTINCCLVIWRYRVLCLFVCLL